VLERGDVRRQQVQGRGGPRDIEDEFVAHPEGGGVILLSGEGMGKESMHGNNVPRMHKVALYP